MTVVTRLQQRTVTALLTAPAAIVLVLLLPSALLAVVIGAMVAIAAWEWAEVAGVVSPPARALFVVIVSVLNLGAWRIHAAPAAEWVIAIGVAWWLVACAWLRHTAFAAAPTSGNAGIKCVAGILAIVPAFQALVTLHALPRHGHGWALYALMLVWAADTSAYLVGSRWGRRKMAPLISPNKTWAGLAGAFAGGGMLALAGALVLGARGIALPALVAVALCAIAASIVGDLFESLLKRQAGVKDSGALFPGHGGILDRLDSVFAALPVLAAGKLLVDYWLSQ